jgi:hypothetical protein
MPAIREQRILNKNRDVIHPGDPHKPLWHYGLAGKDLRRLASFTRFFH